MDTVSYLLGKKNGGGSGTTNYNDLSNKPSINDVTLSGNKTSSDLGVQSEIDSTHKLSADLVDDTNTTNKFVSESDKTTWSGKQDALVSGTNIKTINNQSILGSGDLSISGGGANVYFNEYGESIHLINDTEPGLYFVTGSTNDLEIYDLSDTRRTRKALTYGFFVITKKYSEAQAGDVFLWYQDGTNTSVFKKTNDEYGYTTNAVMSQSEWTKRSNVLLKNNDTSFIPTGDYNPSTKLYTDKTHYENMAGYDATKTQVLKNINGTLTWITEE